VLVLLPAGEVEVLVERDDTGRPGRGGRSRSAWGERGRTDGSARPGDQLRDDLGVVDVTLDPDDVVRLDAVSDPGRADYPYGDIGAEQRSRTPAGS
jgi:hypothetical protein